MNPHPVGVCVVLACWITVVHPGAITNKIMFTMECQHYGFENEQLDGPDLSQLPPDNLFTRDLAYAQSQEDNSHYDNNAYESGDDTPFPDEGDDEEEENVRPELTREHAPPSIRPRVYESHMLFHSRHIPYLDKLSSMLDVDTLTRDLDGIRTTM